MKKIFIVLGVLCLITLVSAAIYQEPWIQNQLGDQHNLSDMDYITANFFSGNITNTSSNIDWNVLQNYPAACPGSGAITILNDSVTCSDLWVDVAGDTMSGNLNITANLTVKGIVTFIDPNVWTGSQSDDPAKGLQLRADGNETGTAIVFWDDPYNTTSKDNLLGQMSAHGTGVGSGQNEIAFYNTNTTGDMNNMFKFLTQRDDNQSLILTGASGISRSSGQAIKMGEDVLGGGTSEVIFEDETNHRNSIILDNSKKIKFEDTGASERAFAYMDGSNDVLILNEGAFADTPQILFQTRDSGNTLRNRFKIGYGEDPDVEILNADLVVDGANLLQLEANTTAMVCNVTNEGGVYYDGTVKVHYGCNATRWNAFW